MIRTIKRSDNEVTAAMIRSVLIEMNVPKVGTAYEDAALDRLFETYDLPKAAYFVVEQDGRIVGGAGIAPLAQYKGAVCELQKMYFLSEIRGKGLGIQMMQRCLDFARKSGFEQVYIETMPNMQAARKLYEKSGFRYLEAPLGNTGHNACSVYLIKKL